VEPRSVCEGTISSCQEDCSPFRRIGKLSHCSMPNYWKWSSPSWTTVRLILFNFWNTLICQWIHIYLHSINCIELQTSFTGGCLWIDRSIISSSRYWILFA
jgi:hypothetical protein